MNCSCGEIYNSLKPFSKYVITAYPKHNMFNSNSFKYSFNIFNSSCENSISITTNSLEDSQTIIKQFTHLNLFIKSSIKCNKKLITSALFNHLSQTISAQNMSINDHLDLDHTVGVIILIVCIILLCCLLYQLKKCLCKCLCCK